MKFLGPRVQVGHLLSHPSRGAWIEILVKGLKARDALVAPLAGCVD